ncbi:hypothetical protein KFZ76_22835 [Methylovulum psychrotolerans]|uniref:hypothetical protein n=1 Tax=Methylovulum psychrotolerans TaxID=1704499 RepID=UPI001BFFA63A|nr:hypothetical protein [Methylovulum psychrotolerans]MBT9100516.1 hypothetical protein [Methylovulum psychrotolerans]MBT9100540.1 hypothetical protein [Methylovulum psychrotolerans]
MEFWDLGCFLMVWVSRKNAFHPSPKLAMDEGKNRLKVWNSMRRSYADGVGNANSGVGVDAAMLMPSGADGFSHPKARYFLLLRQKKVSKEKVVRLPLDPALLGFVGGRQRGLLPRPFGLIPTNPAMLGAANGSKARYCVT